MVLAFGLAVVLFVIIPTYAAKYIHDAVTDAWLLNLFEGILRIAIFLLYIAGISLLKDIGRVFEYHGAEHKTIHAYEKELELTTENIRPLSRIHPRCGTNFLFIVMILSIFMFSFLGWPDLWLRILSRILLLPLVAGLSYEFIRLAGRNKSKLVAMLIAPGFYLQYLTTREPSDDQIEVAIAALTAVKPETEAE
jgi:uncharacterized protein YqhQ